MESYDGRVFKQFEYKEEIQNMCFTDCEFYNCTIHEIALVGCNFSSCRFYNCTVLNVEFQDTDMLNCEFYQCMLVGINWDSLKPRYHGSLPFSVLQVCELRYNIFTRLKLKEFSFRESNLEGSCFVDCNLQGAIFTECNLTDTSFVKNNLTKANFLDVLNCRVNIYENIIKNAKFSYLDAIALLTEIGIVLE